MKRKNKAGPAQKLCSFIVASIKMKFYIFVSYFIRYVNEID